MNIQPTYETFDDGLTEITSSKDQHVSTFNKRIPVPSVKLTNSSEIEITTANRFRQPLPSIRAVDAHLSSFHMLQQWEGKVVAVSKDAFVAIIANRTSPENPQEEVEIELSEISQDDISLVKPGSFFYWAVGYEDAPGIPRQRVSRIRFRRLPGWTAQEIKRAKQRASQLAELFV